MFNCVCTMGSHDNFRLRFFKKVTFDHEVPYSARKKKKMIETPFKDSAGRPLMAKKMNGELSQDEFDRRRQESIRSSMSTTKNRIFKIAMSTNRWKYFVTFTFNKDAVDRYDYDACSKVMRYYLMYERRACPDLQYIIVPEMHKDGAFHFHALMSEDARVEYAGVYRGVNTWHMKKFTAGFTTATEVRDPKAICSYIVKYITKDLCSVTMHRRRYWYSVNTIKVPNDERFLMSVEQYKKFMEYSEKNGYVELAKKCCCAGKDWEYDEIFLTIEAFDEIFNNVVGYDDGTIFYSMDDTC